MGRFNGLGWVGSDRIGLIVNASEEPQRAQYTHGVKQPNSDLSRECHILSVTAAKYNTIIIDNVRQLSKSRIISLLLGGIPTAMC